MREAVEGNTAGLEDDLAVLIHGDDGIVLVDMGGAWIFGPGGYTRMRARSPDECPRVQRTRLRRARTWAGFRMEVMRQEALDDDAAFLLGRLSCNQPKGDTLCPLVLGHYSA